MPWVFLRQGRDGPQVGQLDFVLCGQILQDKDSSRSEEELSPAQIKDKETFATTHAQKGSSGPKREGRHPIVSDVNLPIVLLFARIHLGWEVCAHTGEDAERNQIWTQSQAKQDDWPEETQKKCSI